MEFIKNTKLIIDEIKDCLLKVDINESEKLVEEILKAEIDFLYINFQYLQSVFIQNFELIQKDYFKISKPDPNFHEPSSLLFNLVLS